MNPTVIGWARPLAFEGVTYHGVIVIDPLGSVVVACVGRWSAREPRHYLDGRDRDRDDAGHVFTKCVTCDRFVQELQRLDRVVAASAAWPMCASDFDLSDINIDIGGEG